MNGHGREEEHIHIHLNLSTLEHRLDRIGDRLDEIHNQIQTTGEEVMADLTRLTSEVSESITVQQSAITLLNQLAEMLRDAADDPAEINALADQLDSQGNALAAAVAANTPAASNP